MSGRRSRRDALATAVAAVPAAQVINYPPVMRKPLEIGCVGQELSPRGIRETACGRP